MRLLIGLFLFSLLNLASQGAEKRIALLIGNSNYTYTATLSNPVNDVQSMAIVLRKLDFEVIQYQDLDQIGFKRAIDEFGSKLSDYDIGMFFYAGHGLQINGTNYLIPVDANIDSEMDVEYTCINAGRLLAKMESNSSSTNIIILDACRNNPFKKSWKRSIEKDGLAFMEAPVGSIIAYSTAPGEAASDGYSKNSLYTEALLENIANPKLNSLQVFQEVRKQVRMKSNGNQVPWESTSLENDFYFNQSFDETGYAQINEDLETKEEVPDRKDIISRINQVKGDTKFIWAEGTGQTVSEADKFAQFNISIEILKSIYGGEPGLNGLLKKHQKFCTEVQSFVTRRVYKVRKDYIVFRYIPISEVKNQTSYMVNKIESIYQSGLEAEEKLNFQDAIRYYFWSYALISNHPGGDLKRKVEGHTEGLITMDGLEEHINGFFGNIECTISDSVIFRGSYRYRVNFNFGGEPLKSIGYKYWNGVSWSDLNTTNNGKGFIDVYSGYNSNDIKINYEYKYPESAKYDNYLYSVLSSFNDASFRTRSISSPVISNESPVNETQLNDDFLPVVRSFLSAINYNTESGHEGRFTDEGLDIFRNLILYGNASTFYSDTIFQTFWSGDNIFIKGIPLKFDFPNCNTEFVENITLELTPEGLINNISFSLESKAVNDILNQERWPDLSKWEIIRFLENYKTAYALKRFDYIDKIFSDRALIIVGKRIEEATRSDDNMYTLKDEKFQMTRLSKDQYMYRLKKVFDGNEFINIKFEDNIIRKRDNTSDVYGINIKQNYYSSSYADQGYLFLMVDLKDNNKPTIYVRSWQPEKFSDGQVVNLSDFTY